VVGMAGDGAETLRALPDLQPDVLLLDIKLPDVTGIEVARLAIRLMPSLRILALSGYADAPYIDEMLKAGACGYVIKSAGAEELIVAIRAVAGGRNFLSHEAAHSLLSRRRGDSAGGDMPASVLGKREREVLTLLAAGKRAAEIASHLGITVPTVEVHRRNIKQKLGLYTTAELTRYAIREGLISA
jgi:two-component system NarL family response regulator